MTIVSAHAAMTALALALLAAPAAAFAGQPPPAASPAPAAATAPVPTSAPAAAPAYVRIPEGTEMRVRFNDALSSGTNSEGDQFSITLDDDVDLPGGLVLKRGYRGKGEVTSVKKKGMMGQAGEMNVRLNYLKIGDARVHLRGQKGGEGNGAVGTTVVLTVLFGPLGLLKHGHDIEIHSGQVITAYVDEDAKLAAPLEPPPHDG